METKALTEYRSESASKTKVLAARDAERMKIEALLSQLDEQPRRNFPRPRRQIDAPPRQGVYLIRAVDGAVLHVGRTVSGQRGLAQRLRNHLSGKSSFVRGFLGGDAKLLRCKFQFQYIEIESDRERALLEHRAIAWYCPAHLGLGRQDSE